MIVLFILRHSGYLRNYDTTIKMLCQRGHRVYVAFNKVNKKFGGYEELFDNVSNLCFVAESAPVRKDAWWVFSRISRYFIDYLRYLDPAFAGFSKIKDRASRRIPAFFDRVASFIVFPGMLKFLISVFKSIEKAIPSCRQIDNFIEKFNPDIMLVTPYVDLASEQVDYIKSAVKLGISNGYCVASWDNLTSKGLIKIEPQAVILWNDLQKNEAVRFHNVPESKIFVTGAQCYDQWFAWKPSLPRAEFLEKSGLKSGNYALYLCSSKFISQKEVAFIKDWIRAMRMSEIESIKNLGILIRPHPQNSLQFSGVDFSEYENIAVYPRSGDNPVCDRSKSVYFDSLFYSSVVVGINTSAMIEAGILGKPVLSLELPGMADSNKGTMHYHYLKEGGLLFTDESFESHINRLNHILSGDESYENGLNEFVKKFVRPHGIDRACTPLVVQAIEKIAVQPQTTQSDSVFAKMAQWAFFPVAIICHAVYTLLKSYSKNLENES